MYMCYSRRGDHLADDGESGVDLVMLKAIDAGHGIT